MLAYLNAQTLHRQQPSDLFFNPRKLPSVHCRGVYCAVVVWELPKVAVGSRTVLITTAVQRESHQKHQNIWPLKTWLSEHGA